MRRTWIVVGSLVVSLLGACAPAHDPPRAATSPSPAPLTAGDDVEQNGESLLPPPPTATLRAPADDRREEVAPDTGLPPPQSQ